MIRFEIREQFQEQVDETLLRQAVLATLGHLGGDENVSLTVIVTGDEQIQTLNRRYRNVDAPTDVLSFSAGDTDPGTLERYLGDVLISYPQAELQAQTRGHATGDELQLLVIHGVLHLLGYDHAAPDEKTIMWERQSEILAELGLDIEVTR